MTQRTAKRLKALREATMRYEPCVRKQLSKAGNKRPSSAMVESAAKYYVALQKLAEK